MRIQSLKPRKINEVFLKNYIEIVGRASFAEILLET